MSDGPNPDRGGASELPVTPLTPSYMALGRALQLKALVHDGEAQGGLMDTDLVLSLLHQKVLLVGLGEEVWGEMILEWNLDPSPLHVVFASALLCR